MIIVSHAGMQVVHAHSHIPHTGTHTVLTHMEGKARTHTRHVRIHTLSDTRTMLIKSQPSTAQRNTLQYITAKHIKTRHNTQPHSTGQSSATQRGTTQHSTEQDRTTQHNTH